MYYVSVRLPTLAVFSEDIRATHLAVIKNYNFFEVHSYLRVIAHSCFRAFALCFLYFPNIITGLSSSSTLDVCTGFSPDSLFVEYAARHNSNQCADKNRNNFLLACIRLRSVFFLIFAANFKSIKNYVDSLC